MHLLPVAGEERQRMDNVMCISCLLQKEREREREKGRCNVYLSVAGGERETGENDAAGGGGRAPGGKVSNTFVSTLWRVCDDFLLRSTHINRCMATFPSTAQQFVNAVGVCSSTGHPSLLLRYFCFRTKRSAVQNKGRTILYFTAGAWCQQRHFSIGDCLWCWYHCVHGWPPCPCDSPRQSL